MIGFAKQAISACALSSALIGLAACGPSATPSQNATTLVTQGLKAQLGGDRVTAARDYQDAIRADQYNAVAHYDLGTVDDLQGNTVGAVEQYTAAIDISPSFADALFNLAVDTSGASPANAKQLYLKVVSLQPAFAAAWLNLGFVSQREGSMDEARADWARAVSLDRALASRLPAPAPSASASGGGRSSPSPLPQP